MIVSGSPSVFELEKGGKTEGSWFLCPVTGFGVIRHSASSSRPAFGPSTAFNKKGKIQAAESGPSIGSGTTAVVIASNPFAALDVEVTKPQKLISSDGSVKDVDQATAERLVKSRVDEFFNVKSIEEAVSSFEDLPESRHSMLIQALMERAMEMKASEVILTAKLFERLKNQSRVPHEVFDKAFEPVFELLDDTAVE